MPIPKWSQEIETGEMSIEVGPEGVSLAGPGGSEEMTLAQIEQLYQVLVDYRRITGLEWEWSRKGHDWWK
jgi:hypothetical protein